MIKKKAVLKYKPNNFDILEEGDHVKIGRASCRERV